MVKFINFSRPLSVFSREILFSRTFQDSPVYSSTFQACANPVQELTIVCILVFVHLVLSYCLVITQLTGIAGNDKNI